MDKLKVNNEVGQMAGHGEGQQTHRKLQGAMACLHSANINLTEEVKKLFSSSGRIKDFHLLYLKYELCYSCHHCDHCLQFLIGCSVNSKLLSILNSHQMQGDGISRALLRTD